MCLKHYSCFLKGWIINRVLKTQFPGRHHVEKMSHQAWSDHGNWVFETQFISLNQVFETRDISKIYTSETVPTNYIVGKMGLIPKFGWQCIVKPKKINKIKK